MEARSKIAPAEFEALVRKARLIVAHAGIGTVLTAARCGKPILLMPRRADLGEHRSDHQLATVRRLEGRPGILIAWDESELPGRIAQAAAMQVWSATTSPTAVRLHQAIAHFIERDAA